MSTTFRFRRGGLDFKTRRIPAGGVLQVQENLIGSEYFPGRQCRIIADWTTRIKCHLRVTEGWIVGSGRPGSIPSTRRPPRSPGFRRMRCQDNQAGGRWREQPEGQCMDGGAAELDRLGLDGSRPSMNRQPGPCRVMTRPNGSRVDTWTGAPRCAVGPRLRAGGPETDRGEARLAEDQSIHEVSNGANFKRSLRHEARPTQGRRSLFCFPWAQGAVDGVPDPRRPPAPAGVCDCCVGTD